MDKYEFKKALLSDLPDTKQDELIFWKKKIPMPVDLVYRMFDDRAAILGIYADHLMAAYLFAFGEKQMGRNWVTQLEKQPSSDNLEIQNELRKLYHDNLTDSRIAILQEELNSLLLIPEHSFGEEKFLQAICHQGKKYKRLYMSAPLKTVFQKFMPELLDHISVSNGDMFSNVVADMLGVYRMGFADAFSVMFNKLIDYTVENSLSGSTDYSREARIVVIQEQASTTQEPGVHYGKVRDGSLFEPLYKNSHTDVVININHPFCIRSKQSGIDTVKVMEELVFEMAIIENETLRDSERKVLEIFRQNFSRRLRLKIEEDTLR